MNATIDEENHKSLEERDKLQEGNHMPKCVVSLKKLYDL